MCVWDAESSGRTERESRWRWGRKWRGWSESEKEMTSLRKCWAGFKGYWMKEVYSHSAPSVSPSFYSLMRCTARVVFPSLHGWLMEGGLNILNSPSLSSFFSPYSSLSSFFSLLFGYALVKCTHDPVSATAVHIWNLHDIMLYFWDQRDEWRYSECPPWLSIASPGGR